MANLFKFKRGNVANLPPLEVGEAALTLDSKALYVGLASGNTKIGSEKVKYLDDVTGNIQAQINGKAATSHNHSAANITSGVLPLERGGTGTNSAAGIMQLLGITATAAELNFMDGVTSNVQTQLNGKQASITGAATTITGANLVADRALVSNSAGKVGISAVTATQLGYLSGVTSAIQTQLNGKAPAVHGHAAGDIQTGNAYLTGVLSSFQRLAVNGAYVNQMQFLPPSGIKFEISEDDGETWAESTSLGDYHKQRLVDGKFSGTVFSWEKTKQFRITFTPVDRYCTLDTLIMRWSTAGATCKIKLEYSTIGAKDTYTTYYNGDQTTSGWPAWAAVRHSQINFGGGSDQTSNPYRHRITIIPVTLGNTETYPHISLYGIGWLGANTYSGNDKLILYDWNIERKVSFFNDVTAPKFVGALNGNADTATSLTGLTATVAELNKMDGVTATTAELNHVKGVTSAIQTQLNGKQATITGGATTIASANLTASRALVSDSSGKVAVSAVTSTELGYLAGVTSAIQTQLNGKAATSHNHSAANITSGTLAIARGGTGATTAAGIITNLGITATAAELNHVKGVTSAIQTQLNGKLSTTGTAAAATKLATPRKINGVDFDGTKDITALPSIIDGGTF